MKLYKFKGITVITLKYWVLIINFANPNGYALDLRDPDGIQVMDRIQGKRVGLHWLGDYKVA